VHSKKERLITSEERGRGRREDGVVGRAVDGEREKGALFFPSLCLPR
jgi:hypothetical protein